MALHPTRRLLFGILLLLFVVGSGRQVVAQEAPPQSALAVSPAIMEEVLTPGEPLSFSINVHNITNSPLPIKSFVRNLTVQSADLEKTDRDRLDASRWFSITEPDFILQPNQVRTVEGKILAPADASPGGHYATIYFQPLVPEEALSPSMAYINTRVGVLAFLVVKGEIEQKAELGKSLRTKGFIRSGPAEFSFSIHNSGNVHLIPAGELKVFDWRGRQVAKLPIPTNLILPDSTKKYAMRWDPPGVVGKYRAELALTYGADRVALPKTTVTFWMVPWLEAVVGALLLCAIFFIFNRTRRKWRKAWRAYHHQG